jgi:hypothetical protein
MPPVELVVEVMLWGGLLPAAVAAIVLWFAPRGSDVKNRAATTLALAAGYLAGVVAQDRASLVTLTPVGLLPWFAVLAGAVSVVEAAPKWPVLVGVVLRLAVAALAGWLLTPDQPDLAPVRLWYRLAIGGVVFADWTALDFAASRRLGRWVPALVAFTALAGVAVLEKADIGRFTQFAVSLTAASAGATVALRDRPAHGLAGVAAILVTGLMAAGRFESFSKVPAASYLLVALAPLGLAAGALAPERWRGWTATALMAIVAGTAVALAVRAAAE